MKKYLLTDNNNVVLSVVECIDEATPEVEGDFNLVITTEDVFQKYHEFIEYKIILDPKSGVITPIKHHPNTDWSFISFSEGVVGDASLVKTTNGDCSLYFKGKEWMSNSKQLVLELSSQYYTAHGDVLVGGLGMGIVALIAACKDNVTSVTVVELEYDVIELFKLQKFDMSKITIVHGSIYDHEGSYDSVLMDYYNVDDMVGDFIEDERAKLTAIKSNSWDWYLEELINPVSTQGLVSAITSINERKGKTHEVIYNLKDLISSALNSISQYDLPYEDTTVFNKDYFVYNITNDEYQAVGISWKYFDKVYSIKYQYGEISDFYEIYTSGDIFSSELDMETKEIICNYPHSGDNKVSPEGEVLQINYPLDSVTDIPNEVFNKLINQNFPYAHRAFYFAEKPYGDILECSIPPEMK